MKTYNLPKNTRQVNLDRVKKSEEYVVLLMDGIYVDAWFKAKLVEYDYDPDNMTFCARFNNGVRVTTAGGKSKIFQLMTDEDIEND